MAKRQHIICVKVAQRVLTYYGKNAITNPYHVFPYDRVYLVKNYLLPKFTRSFRYYFSMPLDKRLLAALNRMDVATIRSVKRYRDDVALEGHTGKPEDNFKKLVPTPKNWTLVAPTHVKSVKYLKNGTSETEEGLQHTVSTVQYFFTQAINPHQQNSHVRMPRITFHTPERTIPVACAICKNTPSFYANECTPGTYKCQQNHTIRLAEDRYFKRTNNESREELGGE